MRYYSSEYIKQAHKTTIFNEKDILDSSLCTCFYCAYQFDPHQEDGLVWTDEGNEKGRTLLCPMCQIDCVIGDASKFPITDYDFIMFCTSTWFGGYSRIDDGRSVGKLQVTPIVVD